MLWLTLQEAADALSLLKNTLRSRASAGTNRWPRKVEKRTDSPNNKRYLYGVPESLEEALDTKTDRWVEEGIVYLMDDADNEAPPLHAHDPDLDMDDLDVEEANYEVIGDFYHFSLDSMPGKDFTVHKTVVENMVQAYSNEGGKATVNQLARILGWRRATVRQILRKLGKTKDSVPFTDEALAAKSEESLVEDMLRLKEEQVHVKASLRHQKKTEQLAEQARDWVSFVNNTLAAIKPTPCPTMPKWKNAAGANLRKLNNKNKVTVVSHPTDLHYGKNGWGAEVGESYNREICQERLISTTTRLIDRIKQWGDPDEVILGVGADWFHIDNQHYTTTKGTPQDCDGTYSQILDGGCSLGRDNIELWRQAFGHVRLACVPGNHDFNSTMFLVKWLQALYKDAEDVTIGSCYTSREYIQVGRTLLGLTHGDGVKDSKLGPLMATEAKELWGKTDYRLWLTGHWHSQRVSEEFGVIVEHLPSLAGTDAWHHRHAYVGNRKALMAHLIDHEEGTFAKILVDADQKFRE